MKKTLAKIIADLGDKEYPYIEFRVKRAEVIDSINPMVADRFKGSASYKGGELKSNDIQEYSLRDVYDEYEETVTEVGTPDEIINPGDTILTVWQIATCGA